MVSQDNNQSDKPATHKGTAGFFHSANNRQLAAGGLAVAFAYASLLTTGFGMIDAPVQTVIAGFQWQHLPLHALFTVAAATAGAAGMAAWDRFRPSDQQQSRQP